MKFQLTRSGGVGALVPVDEKAFKFIADLAEGETLDVEAINPRDMIEHRRIMGFIDELARALHRTPELVRAELLYATGNFKLLGELSNMSPAVAVNSMARTAMTDRELHTFWAEAREVIETQMLPRVSCEADRERLVELLYLQPA